MKSFTFCILAFALVAYALAADECDVKGHKFKKGEKYAPLGECVQYTCDGPAVNTQFCPSVASPKPCKLLPEDLTKAYPACCAHC